MRLVYLLTSLGIGGAERQVVAVATRMAACGHQVALLVLRPRCAQEWPSGLDTTYLNMRKRPWELLRGIWQGRRWLRSFAPDILHSHTFPANLAARLMSPFLPNMRLVATIHNVYEGSWWRSLAYRLTDRMVAATTAVSQAVAERSIAAKVVPPEKCTVLCNGIDIEEFHPDAARRQQMRQRMEAGSAFIWLAAGRPAPAKDYPNLLRAFARLRVSWPQAELWIAGETQCQAAQLLRAWARQENLSSGVRWLGLRRDLPALLDAADGFVLSSAWEGMPLVVGEAMAMEKPVAATDVGGVRELLGDTEGLVPARDSPALAAAMSAWMHWPEEERRLWGHAARQRIATCFSMDRIANRWEDFYRQVLNARNGPPELDLARKY